MYHNNNIIALHNKIKFGISAYSFERVFSLLIWFSCIYALNYRSFRPLQTAATGSWMAALCFKHSVDWTASLTAVITDTAGCLFTTKMLRRPLILFAKGGCPTSTYCQGESTFYKSLFVLSSHCYDAWTRGLWLGRTSQWRWGAPPWSH